MQSFTDTGDLTLPQWLFTNETLLSTLVTSVLLPLIVSVITLFIEHKSGFLQANEEGMTVSSIIWRCIFVFLLSYSLFLFVYGLSSFAEQLYSQRGLILTKNNPGLAYALTYATFVIPIAPLLVAGFYLPRKKELRGMTFTGGVFASLVAPYFASILIMNAVWIFLIVLMGSYPFREDIDSYITMPFMVVAMQYRYTGDETIIVFTNYVFSFLFFAIFSVVSMLIYVITHIQWADEYKSQNR